MRQPVYINNNSYLAGAKGFDGEKNKIETDYDPKISVIEESDGFYLEIDMPEEAFISGTKRVSTKKLPIPRITESPYENADGTELVIDRDYFGNARADIPAAGPFENLAPGRQKILVWEKK